MYESRELATPAATLRTNLQQFSPPLCPTAPRASVASQPTKNCTPLWYTGWLSVVWLQVGVKKQSKKITVKKKKKKLIKEIKKYIKKKKIYSERKRWLASRCLEPGFFAAWWLFNSAAGVSFTFSVSRSFSLSLYLSLSLSLSLSLPIFSLSLSLFLSLPLSIRHFSFRFLIFPLRFFNISSVPHLAPSKFIILLLCSLLFLFFFF